MSSILGLFPCPGNTLYSATKAFVVALSLGVGYEVKDDSQYQINSEVHSFFDENLIQLQCLCPGPVQTSLLGVNFKHGILERLKQGFHLSVEKCVAASLRDLSFVHINFNQKDLSKGHWAHDSMMFACEVIRGIFFFEGIFTWMMYKGFNEVGNVQRSQ